jgi:hypothetical protein
MADLIAGRSPFTAAGRDADDSADVAGIPIGDYAQVR